MLWKLAILARYSPLHIAVNHHQSNSMTCWRWNCIDIGTGFEQYSYGIAFAFDVWETYIEWTRC